MSEQNRGQELRLKNIDEIRNYSFKEINQNELMSKKYKKIWIIEFWIILTTYLL